MNHSDMQELVEAIQSAIAQYASTGEAELLEQILGSLATLPLIYQAPLLTELKSHKAIHHLSLSELRAIVRTFDKPLVSFFDDNGSFEGIKMMEALEQEGMRFVSVYGETGVRIYQQGVYLLDKGALIEKAVRQKLQYKYGSRHGNEALKVIDSEHRVATFEELYHADKVNFRNGVLDIQTGEFTEHAELPDFKSILQLPFRYTPTATCPNFDAFLHNVLPELAQRELIYQAIACAVYQGVPPLSQFIWLFLGPTHTGKSTLLRIIAALLGEANVSHEKLVDLADRDNRFSRFQLAGKFANIDADASVSWLRGDGLLKQISAGDRISIQGKGQPASDASLISTLFIGLNQLPPSADTTSGFLNRLMPIRFDVQHEGQPDKHVPARCTTQTELAGIFNQVFPFLQALVNDDMHVERTEDERQSVAAYAVENMNDPVGIFVDSYCHIVGIQDMPEPETDLEEAFEAFLEDHGVPKSKRPSKKTLRNTITDRYAVDVKSRQVRTEEGRRVWVGEYYGIQLKEQSE